MKYDSVMMHDLHGLPLRYHQLKTKWDGKNYEVLLATKRLEQSSHHKLLVEVKELQKEVGEWGYG